MTEEHSSQNSGSLNNRLEESFARWIEETPFSAERQSILHLKPVAKEKLYTLYAKELVRLKQGRYASFEEVFGPLLREAGFNFSRYDGQLEGLERRFLARNFVYLDRRVEQAWKDVLAGDFDCGVPELLKAARAGHGRALLYASRLFRNGIGVEKDAQKALDALENAAETDCGQASLELFTTLAQGELGISDSTKARQCLEKACRLADPDTWAGLGRALTCGALGSGRVGEGVEFLRRAVKKGNADAAYDLGALIAAGKADEKEETPFELLQLAARRGSIRAMHDLAFLFLREARTSEEGNDLNPKECFRIAVHWLVHAAQAGDGESAKLLKNNLSLTLSDGTVARLKDYLPRS